jgi:hypothetical protein
MLVLDHPVAINFVVANGRTNPNVGFDPICPLSSDPVEAVAEGNFIAGSNYQFVLLAAQRFLDRGQPLLPVLATSIGALILQRRREIEQQHVWRIVRMSRSTSLARNAFV